MFLKLAYLANILVFSLFMVLSHYIYAAENIQTTKNQAQQVYQQRGPIPCSAPTATIDLDINNVRAKLFVGGDMWWDKTSAKYEVPKGGGKHAIFAGSMWIGGIDNGKQLKVAAQTYRQGGSDFYAGPLNALGITDFNICNAWNLHFKLTKAEVDAFKADNSNITNAITNWPARNNPYNTDVGDVDLAPFVDVNNDGIYDPITDGDYPNIRGDQFIWWVFNDMGNLHVETGGVAIGVEVQGSSFAFSTTDDVNNMTFYRYKAINRSPDALYNTYIGQFVDADLGCHLDDYVGCDVSRNLGYCYNGDDDDASCGTAPVVVGYAPVFPAVGLKFLVTPYDNNWDALGMSVFLAFNNDLSSNGNPEEAGHFYNYLIGRWKDNTDLTWGGIGFGGSTPTKHMYPGMPCITGEWTEWSAGNTPGDRRFVMSSGPFDFLPGQIVDLEYAVVWAGVTTGNACTPVENIKIASDLAETFYESIIGLEEIETRSLVHAALIFPNPVVDRINVSIPGVLINTVEVIDISGKRVYFQEGLNNYRFSFNRSGLETGLYLIRITDNKGGIYADKVVFE